MNSRATLAISAGLNVGLLITTAYYFLRPVPPPAPPERLVRTNTVVKVAARTLTVSEASSPIQLDWRSLESADYRLFIYNLREAHCPEETIKDIVIADVGKMFGKKFREQAALLSQQRVRRYWKKPGPDEEKVEAAINLLRRQMAKEQRDLIRELLGTDLAMERSRASLEWHDNGAPELRQFLPEAKAAEVAALREKHRIAMERFRDSTGSKDWTEEETRKWKYLMAEQEAELAGMLTDKERAQYDLWFSETASNLRQELSEFEPSEKEFLSLHALKKSFEKASIESPGAVSRKGVTRTDDAVSALAREQALKEHEAQIAKALGADRFEQYQRARDPEFRELLEFAQSIDADAEAAPMLFEIRQAVEEETDRIESDPSMNAAEKERNLRLMREETDKALLSMLGREGFSTLTRRFPNWIQRPSLPTAPVARPAAEAMNPVKIELKGRLGP